MPTFNELILRHARIKAQVTKRDEERKQRKAEFEEALKEDLLNVYGDVDLELEEVRNQLRELVAASPDKLVVGEAGQALIEQRSLSWDVFDFDAFALWVAGRKRANDLLKVQQANVNKLCDGLTLASEPLPEGVKRKFTEVLEVKIATRPETVE